MQSITQWKVRMPAVEPSTGEPAEQPASRAPAGSEFDWPADPQFRPHGALFGVSPALIEQARSPDPSVQRPAFARLAAAVVRLHGHTVRNWVDAAPRYGFQVSTLLHAALAHVRDRLATCTATTESGVLAWLASTVVQALLTATEAAQQAERRAEVARRMLDRHLTRAVLARRDSPLDDLWDRLTRPVGPMTVGEVSRVVGAHLSAALDIVLDAATTGCASHVAALRVLQVRAEERDWPATAARLECEVAEARRRVVAATGHACELVIREMRRTVAAALSLVDGPHAADVQALCGVASPRPAPRATECVAPRD
jgi:hypothetical protein